MSASTISRWNAIPLSRPESNLKRSRPEEETGNDDNDDDDDDISIVPRTPSPQPMDVDTDLSKYDEYVSGTPREVITVETKIKPTNKGFAMLAKLGWSEGQSLGISGDGRVDPIPFQIKRDLTGLGKTNQDVRMIETTVSQRRGLDSERQQKETEDQRRAREDLVARKSALESEISTTLKAFYCTLCDKQFKTVAQYDEHTNSYAHHHKARFRDMQANIRLKPKEEVDKRKEKERKREEKELRKIAAANGIKMAKPSVTPTTALDAVQAGSSSSMEIDSNPPPPPKRAGWATVSSTAEPPKQGGWAAVSSTPAASATPDAPPAAPTASSTNSSSYSGQQSSAPSFRTAGWTSLDTGSSQPMPSQVSGPIYTPPPPLPSSWTNVTSNNQQSTSAGEWNSLPPHTVAVVPPPPLPLSPLPPLPSPPPSVTTAVRSGWQKFQKSTARKR